jgi:hypothetical protein
MKQFNEITAKHQMQELEIEKLKLKFWVEDAEIH